MYPNNKVSSAAYAHVRGTRLATPGGSRVQHPWAREKRQAALSSDGADLHGQFVGVGPGHLTDDELMPVVMAFVGDASTANRLVLHHALRMMQARSKFIAHADCARAVAQYLTDAMVTCTDDSFVQVPAHAPWQPRSARRAMACTASARRVRGECKARARRRACP